LLYHGFLTPGVGIPPPLQRIFDHGTGVYPRFFFLLALNHWSRSLLDPKHFFEILVFWAAFPAPHSHLY